MIATANASPALAKILIMAHGAQLLDEIPGLHPRRRRHPRQTLRSLAYVTLDGGNGGIIRDLTESGIAVQVVAPLRPGQEMDLQFDLLSPRVRVEGRGRVLWANPGGQAGILFLDLASRTRRALRNWQLNQMFATAALSGRDSMFSAVPFVRDLSFSIERRRAIIVESLEPPFVDSESLPIRWKFLKFPARWFAMGIDAMLLLVAALLFAGSSIWIMGSLPPWPIAAVLFLTSSTIFVAVYELLFSELLARVTPGKRFAKLVAQEDESSDFARFR